MSDGIRSLLVTGGAGFVGANLACLFRQRHPGLQVTCLDNLRRRGSELNLPRLRAAGARFVHGDVRNPADLAAAGPVDLILECSAEPSVLAGYGPDRGYVIETNLMGTVNCLEHAVRHGAGMIFLSTSRVYPIDPVNAIPFTEEPSRFGLPEGLAAPGATAHGINEEFPLAGARSLYGATKLCSEILIAEYAAAQGLRAVVNRCGVISGPWQLGRVDQGVAAHWLLCHQLGRPLTYIGFGGYGKQVRDFLHVDDLFELIEIQISRLEALAGRVFNVGGGADNSLSLVEMTSLCRELTRREVRVGSDPVTRPGDVRIYITDNSRVTEATGWRPLRDTRRIFSEMNAWVSEQRGLIESALAG